MGITDAGLPSTDPHTILSNFITTNLTSPEPGTWTVVVNDEWLQPKKQKTYQICITPSYGWTDQAQMTALGETEQPMITQQFMEVTLFAPTREKLWSLHRNFITVMNNQTLTVPQDAAGYTGVGGTEVHFLRVVRSEEMKSLRLLDKKCDGDTTDGGCLGWRSSITVSLRWNE